MHDAIMRTMTELEAGLDAVRQSPRDGGVLEMIVRRPAEDQREVLETAELDVKEGLVGDNWNQRPSSHMPDHSPHPDMQIAIINARLLALVAGERERWPLAGDQLVADLDLAAAHLTPGTRLAIGGALLEITEQPHTGCKKFLARYGMDALKFVNGPTWKELRLRGIYAKVVQSGTIRAGDAIRRVE